MELFAEVSQNLIYRAADFLTISSKKENDVTLKKLKEKVDELEKEKSEMKTEYQSEKRLLE